MLRGRLAALALLVLLVRWAAGDYYSILGLKRDAARRDIVKAYRKRALELHPDKVAPERRDEASARFIEVVRAYEVLSDPEERRRYDEIGHSKVRAASLVPGRGGLTSSPAPSSRSRARRPQSA